MISFHVIIEALVFAHRPDLHMTRHIDLHTLCIVSKGKANTLLTANYEYNHLDSLMIHVVTVIQSIYNGKASLFI